MMMYQVNIYCFVMSNLLISEQQHYIQSGKQRLGIVGFPSTALRTVIESQVKQLFISDCVLYNSNNILYV